MNVRLLNFFFGVCLSLSFTKIIFAQPTHSFPPSPPIPSEECSWRTHEYTEKLIQEHLGKQEEDSQTEAQSPCIDCDVQSPFERGFSGISHFLNNIFSQGNAKNSIIPEEFGPIPSICFFAHMVRSENASERNQEKFVYCEDTTSIKEPDQLMLFDQCKMKERSGFQTVLDKMKAFFDQLDEDREECQLSTKSDAQIGRVQNLHSRRFCLNADYLQLTAEAFNKVADCFGYSDEDKKHMFKVISHESHFMLNKRGLADDACYGQVTNIIHHDLNRYIVYKTAVSAWAEEYNIYKNAIDKEGCHFLSQKVVHFPGVRPEDIWTTNSQGKEVLQIGVDEFDNRYNSKEYSMLCRLTHDPYTCFLYSFYNYKINELTFEEEYEDSDDTTLPADLMRDFHAPIRHNEMIVFRGDIIEPDGSVKKDIELTFSGHDEIRRRFITEKYSYSKDSQIYKVNIFPKDILQKDIVSRSYQGGKGIITRYWPAFMTKLKDNISNLSNIDQSTEESLQQYEQYKTYREALTKNDALLNPKKGVLQAVDLDREFSRYLYDRDREQTSQYVSKMEEGVCFYEDDYMKNLLRTRFNVRSKDADSIIQYVQENCPPRRFETLCLKKDQGSQMNLFR